MIFFFYEEVTFFYEEFIFVVLAKQTNNFHPVYVYVDAKTLFEIITV